MPTVHLKLGAVHNICKSHKPSISVRSDGYARFELRLCVADFALSQFLGHCSEIHPKPLYQLMGKF